VDNGGTVGAAWQSRRMPSADATTATSATAAARTPAADLRAEAEGVLRALVGRADARLRDDQWTAIDALVRAHRRALVVQRTGWGKSAVYFVATALLRSRGAGPTVIVSPLLALMRNQIAAAQRAGIRAVTVNSTNREAWEGIYDEIRAGVVDVLLVSPERLNNPDFRDLALPRLTAAAGLVVVDEAHCISDWGHDFRPDYRRIRSLLGELPAGVPVLATTATANARVTADVAEQLAAGAEHAGEGAPGAGTPGDVLVLRGDLDRPSLRLGVVRLPGPAQRLAWLAAHLGDLPGSGIVYCLTVAATQQVAEHLRAHGHEVIAYSGQTDDADRLAAEDALLGNRVKALVATSALGMGFDKPDLGFVVHLGAPPSPIAYYQQVGRAGRAVERASVVLLPGREDKEVWDYFASLAFPAEHLVRQTLRVLAEEGRPLSTAALEPRVELRRTRLEMMLKVLDVDGAVRRVRGGWESTGQPWSYDEARYERVAATRRHEQAAMLEYAAGTTCRLGFRRVGLDDPGARPCGRCDNCGGLTLPGAVPDAEVTQARERLDQPGVPVEPRRQWPSSMATLGVELRGAIPAAERAEPGRAVARLTDLGWGDTLRTLFRDDTPDGEVPVPLRHAVVRVLDAWPFEDRPDAVVHVESLRRPTLVTHLSEGLARYTRLPVVARLRIVSSVPPGAGSSNSAQRLRVVSSRYALDDPDAVAGRSVLLVDDRTDTGWTMTVCARLLRQAGARAVHPLVLAAGT
jgi:ATP-dependent DNA helicase RecQ